MSVSVYDHPVHVVTRSEVCSPETFALYAQQHVGTPYPGYKQMIVLRKQLNDFFEAYPDLGYPVLVRVADWCRAKKRRPFHAYSIITMLRYAWADGAVPDLDPSQRRAVARIR